jgi:tRNA(Ile)-lysidine synthase
MNRGRGAGPGQIQPNLAHRFSQHLADQGRVGPGDRLVVALSGGVDSLVLLHLLRFGEGFPADDLLAAHFDHNMREASGADALWVRGLCRAWGVEVKLARAEVPPSSEEEAREARYGFLLDAYRQVDGRWLLTAHHSDDQAETVLFRALRGTGLRGLAGIPSTRTPGILRPLLPFGRREIQEYANAVGLRPRQDASNLDLANPRNFLRHEIIPKLEEGVAPRARKSLNRLARLARENEDAWQSLLPTLMDGVVKEDEGRVFIVRSGFLAYHPAVQARLLRDVLRRFGIRLDESGTRAVLEFTRTGASGRSLDLPGGYSLTREFDRLQVRISDSVTGDHPLVLEGPAAGVGEVLVSGKRFAVVWGEELPESCDETLGVLLSALEFPLRLRGWLPGDRMAFPYGTKKLKKLLAEARIPVSERGRIPVLLDARGRVLWAAGLASSVSVQVGTSKPTYFFGIREIHES